MSSQNLQVDPKLSAEQVAHLVSVSFKRSEEVLQRVELEPNFSRNHGPCQDPARKRRELRLKLIEELLTKYHLKGSELFAAQIERVGSAPGCTSDRCEHREHSEPVRDEVVDPLVERTLTDVDKLHLRLDPRPEMPHCGTNQLVTVVEITVDRPRRHAREDRHIFDRRFGVARLEQFDHSVEDSGTISLSPSDATVAGDYLIT